MQKSTTAKIVVATLVVIAIAGYIPFKSIPGICLILYTIYG